MSKKFLKIVSSCAMAVMLAFTSAAAQETSLSTLAYTDEIDNSNDFSKLNVCCPTNDDWEFPFSIDIDVAPNSIQYVELDEPIYGFESILDEEALDFEVNFSLKNEYLDFDYYSFNVHKSDYTDEIVSEYLESGDIFTLPGLSLGIDYKFDIELQSDILKANYVGQFTIQAELDSTLVIDLFYQNFSNEDGFSLYSYINKETEDNNSELKANFIGNGSIYEGSLPNYSDVDYFYFYTPKANDNIVNLDISLSVPKGLMIDVEIYSEDGKYHKKTLNSINSSLYVRMTNVAQNTKFYVKLNCRVGTAGGTYRLVVNRTTGNAWFGQFVSYIGGQGDFWNSHKLDTLKITGGSETKPFFINNSTNDHWMKEGCAIASTAMILRNMGATLYGYDFRTDFSGYMPADPFTVMLANCRLDGKTMNPDTTSLNTGSQEPIYMYLGYICERFSVSKKTISYSYVSLNEASLKKAVEDYGFVLVGFNYVTYNSNGKAINHPHYMVITGFTEGDSFADRVLVCDPAAKSYAKGVGEGLGVRLSETTSGYAKMGISNITSAKYLTVAS